MKSIESYDDFELLEIEALAADEPPLVEVGTQPLHHDGYVALCPRRRR